MVKRELEHRLVEDFLHAFEALLKAYAKQAIGEWTVSSTPPGREEDVLFILKGARTMAVFMFRFQGVRYDLHDGTEGFVETGNFDELNQIAKNVFAIRT